MAGQEGIVDAMADRRTVGGQRVCGEAYCGPRPHDRIRAAPCGGRTGNARQEPGRVRLRSWLQSKTLLIEERILGLQGKGILPKGKGAKQGPVCGVLRLTEFSGAIRWLRQRGGFPSQGHSPAADRAFW